MIVRKMTVREAIAEAGFDAVARADFGGRVAYYRARPLGQEGRADAGPGPDAAPASGEDGEVLLRLILPDGEREARRLARLDHPNVLRLAGIRHAPGYRLL